MVGLQSLPLAILAAFGFAFVESGLGLGILVPGETAVVAIAAAVSGPVAIGLVLIAVCCGACAGDHLGYWLGRVHGPRMRESRAVARLGVRHWDRAMALVNRHGAAAVFASRLLPLVRTLTPAVAGSAGLRYGRFLTASLSGSLLWASVYVGGGQVAITVIRAVDIRLGPVAAITIGVAVLLVVVATLLGVRARRRAAASHEKLRPALSPPRPQIGNGERPVAKLP